MSESESRAGLILARASALLRQGPASPTKRGLGDLLAEQAATGCLQRGKELWKQEQWFEAYTLFLQALELSPFCAEALFYIGCICWRFDEFYETSGGESGPWVDIALKSADAENWYLRSAELGFAEAQYELAMVLRGKAFMGTPVDIAKADEWLCKAAKQGHVAAARHLQDRRDEMTQRIRMEQCRQAVEAGNSEAKRFHDWVDEFYSEFTVNWLPSQFTEEWLTRYNSGIPREQIRIPEWWTVRLPDLEEGGKAQIEDLNLKANGPIQTIQDTKGGHGSIVRDNVGIEEDVAQAASNYRIAAEQGDQAAQATLARMYLQNLIPWNEHLRLAASLWDVEDAPPMGYIFCEDEYMRHGYKEMAAYWYRKAARGGNGIAESALAELQPALTLEQAKRTVELSQCHFNFGSDVEARKSHHASIEEAVKVLKSAGYRVIAEGWGYKLEDAQ